jgi:hypothetical protein
MRLALAIALVLAGAVPAHAATADLLVLGKEQKVLAGPQRVTLEPRTVKAGGRTCAVAARTALGVLAGARLGLGIRDHGACTRKARDAAGLYVRSVAGIRAKGRAGWVYKVGRRLASSGAGDPAGPFGSGPLKAGAKVLWFWCRLDAKGACPRTLETAHTRTGDAVRVTVRAYDDFGKGRLVEGATVRLGSASALTGPDGTATLTGSGELVAEKAGAIRSFGVAV